MINMQHISFSYGKNPLFNGLNLNIHPGGIYGLLGKNGAGKSTLLNLICGTFFASSGRLQVFGKNPAYRSKELLQEIFFLPEEVAEISATPQTYIGIYAPFYPKFSPTKFKEIAGAWNIRQNANLKHMSHGERKKFFIAFAIATNCRLIILDEPTNGLDIPAKSLFRSLLAQNNEDSALIISSHQVRDLEGLIDPIIILDNGKIILNSTIATIESKLFFGTSPLPAIGDNVLYKMQTPAGFSYVKLRQKTDDHGMEVDLELLFNAVINNALTIHHLFEGAQ